MDSLPDITATVKRYFGYSLPDNVFIDDNGMSSLIIQIRQSNGDNLPEGISFDHNSFMIHGTPAIAGEYTIHITVEDQEGYTLSDEFLLTIDDLSGIEETRSVLLNIYPNPAKNSVFIDHEIISTSTSFALFLTPRERLSKKGT